MLMPRKRTAFELYRHFCGTLLSDGGSGNPLCCVWKSRRGGDTSLCGSAFDYGLDLLVEARFTCSRNDVNCDQERQAHVNLCFHLIRIDGMGISLHSGVLFFFVFE